MHIDDEIRVFQVVVILATFNQTNNLVSLEKRAFVTVKIKETSKEFEQIFLLFQRRFKAKLALVFNFLICKA